MERGAGDIWAAARSMIYQERGSRPDWGWCALTWRRWAAGYADGMGPFQERAHLVALSFAFLWDYAEFVRRWAQWAQEEVRQWPGGERHSDVFRRALRGSPVLGGPVLGGPETEPPRN